MLIFDSQTQGTGSGGSGCGCAASVLSAHFLPKLASGELERILFVPTGALLSTVSFNEGQTIPGIAHGVVLESCVSSAKRRDKDMQYVIAFVTGGMICALSQILMEKTKMLPGRIMVLLVCLGAILGFVGIYEPFSQWAQAGANVPLLGFGNNLWKGVKEMVDKKGFIGIFLGGFKNCAAGLSAALVFSYIASLLCQPKMKKH